MASSSNSNQFTFDFTNFNTDEKIQFALDIIRRQFDLIQNCRDVVKETLMHIFSPFIADIDIQRFREEIFPSVLGSINIDIVVIGLSGKMTDDQVHNLIMSSICF